MDIIKYGIAENLTPLKTVYWWVHWKNLTLNKV